MYLSLTKYKHERNPNIILAYNATYRGIGMSCNRCSDDDNISIHCIMNNNLLKDKMRRQTY